MVEGFYFVAFTGRSGSGFGVVTFEAGAIAAADASGALYDGSYTEIDASTAIELDVRVRVPAGAVPVQVGVPLTEPMSYQISAKLPLSFDNGNPILVQTELGPINAVFKKIRDLPG